MEGGTDGRKERQGKGEVRNTAHPPPLSRTSEPLLFWVALEGLSHSQPSKPGQVECFGGRPAPGRPLLCRPAEGDLTRSIELDVF